MWEMHKVELLGQQDFYPKEMEYRGQNERCLYDCRTSVADNKRLHRVF